MQREPNEGGKMHEKNRLLIRFFSFNRLFTLFHPITSLIFLLEKEQRPPNIKNTFDLIKRKYQTAEKTMPKGKIDFFP